VALNDDAPKKGLPDFLRLLAGGVSGLIGFVTALVGFIQLMQGNAQLLTKVLSASGVVFLWVSLFYIYYSRNSVRRVGFTGKSEEKPFTYTSRIRKVARVGIFAVPVLVIAGLLGLQYYKRLPPDKVIILVADFQNLEPQSYGVTETIIEQLRQATSKYPDIQILPLGKTITVQEGSEVARSYGSNHKAAVVLWGWCRSTQVTTHVEVLLNKPRSLSLRGEKETRNLAVAELQGFQIQTQISNEMAYLVLLTVGLARLEARDYDGAISRFTDALNQQAVPDQIVEPADIYFYRGNAYISKNEMDRAVADYDQAIKIKPDFAPAYQNRGAVYLTKSDTTRAISDYDRAITIRPESAESYNNRGVAYSINKDLDRAIADYDQAVKLQPAFAVAYANRAEARNRKDQYDLALSDFDRALQLQPDFAAAYQGRARVYLGKGELDLALNDLNQAIKLNSNFAWAYITRGFVYLRKEDFALALADLDKAIKIEPNSADAYIIRGFISATREDVERATADYFQAVAIDPAYATPHTENDDNKDSTRLSFAKPTFALAFHKRALAYAAKGDRERAIADCNQALKITPNYAEVYNSLGNLYDEKGDREVAIENFNKAIKLKPDLVEAYHNRGLAYQHKGDFDRAIADYNYSIKQKPDFAEAYYSRGSAYAKKGDLQRGVADLKQSIELTKDPARRRQAEELLKGFQNFGFK
jgi:tetratricopeptide (TPR) repeat protein